MRIILCVATLGSIISVSHAFTLHTTKATFQTCLPATSAEEESRLLLEKVKKLRAELADLEDKPLSQVEAEALTKKRKPPSPPPTEAPRKGGRDVADRRPPLPEDNASQILQAASAVERAYRDGANRQTVRFALVPEGDRMYELQEWPGGAQQMSREAGVPLTESLLAELRVNASCAVAPERVFKEDIWDFDGSALVTSESAGGPGDDVRAMVLANTDIKYTRDIEEIDGNMGDRLFLLVNPFWRDVESWGINLLSPGAKKLAQKVIFDEDRYGDTYAFHRYSVRGEICAALKVYPYKWQLYAYLEDMYTGYETPIRLGETDEEPGNKAFTELLNEREEFKMSKNMRILQRRRR